MKRVKITDGLYGYRPEGAKHPQPVPAGSLCIVTDAEAARLASIGVGVVLEDITEEDVTGAVATPVEGEDDEGAVVDTHDQGGPAEDEETAHLDPEQLKELTNAKLKELAEEMGIDTAKLKTEAQLIAAITDVPLEDAISGEDDGEGAPAGLGAEGPVE